jgi:hypothetical protein
MVAIGGIVVHEDQVRALETDISQLCRDVGFPSGEPFKWSPGRELWMRDNLKAEARERFFVMVLALVASKGARALVVIEDASRRPATGTQNAEEDVTRLFLERVHHEIPRGSHGIVIVDRVGGDRADEVRFLTSCLETLQQGTEFVLPDRIALSVLSTPARLVRLVQVADLVTSSALATVVGSNRHAAIFEAVRHLLCRRGDRVGGIGLKIHPDYLYANLYHWLLGDSHFWKLNCGTPLPLTGRPYADDPWLF